MLFASTLAMVLVDGVDGVVVYRWSREPAMVILEMREAGTSLCTKVNEEEEEETEVGVEGGSLAGPEVRCRCGETWRRRAFLLKACCNMVMSKRRRVNPLSNISIFV